MTPDWVTWIRRDLDRVSSKLDRVEDNLTCLNITMSANTTNLAEHMKRTDMLEARLDNAGSKNLALFGGVVGVLVGIWQLLSYLKPDLFK